MKQIEDPVTQDHPFARLMSLLSKQSEAVKRECLNTARPINARDVQTSFPLRRRFFQESRRVRHASPECDRA